MPRPDCGQARGQPTRSSSRRETRRSGDRAFAIGLAIVVALLTASSAPWWWNAWNEEASDDFVGGCEPFNLFAQNQFDPPGAKIWVAPSPTAQSRTGFAPNEIVTVDGWVRAKSPYATTNPPPWNADVWFHLADGSGWLTFAGVRSAPTDPSAEGNFGEGSDQASLDESCLGSYRP